MKKMNNGANVNKSTPAAKQRISNGKLAIEIINTVLNGGNTTIVVDRHEDPIFHTEGDDIQLALESLTFRCVSEDGGLWDVAFNELGKFTETMAYVMRLRLKPEELEVLRKKAVHSQNEKDWTIYLDELNYEVSQITGNTWFPKVKREIINSQLAGGDAESLKKAILAKVNEVHYSRLDKDEKRWRMRKLRGLLGEKSISKMVQSLKKAQAKYYGYRD